MKTTPPYRSTALGFAWLALAFLLTACSVAWTQDAGATTPPPAMGGVLATARPTSTPPLRSPLPALPSTAVTVIAPLPTAALPATAIPLEPSATPARFCCLRFTTAVDAPPQTAFPPGITEINALWEYRDMQPNDRVRRIWFRDGLIWLTREEVWPWEEYGASGSVTDIAIYDNEGDGLLPAHYRLQLYVNDTLQQEGTFTIGTP